MQSARASTRPRHAAAAARQASGAGTRFPSPEQAHRARKQYRADDRCVDQERGGDAEAHLLEHDQLAAREAGEDGDDDQRRPGDDPRGRGDAEADGIGRVAGCVEALLDPAEQEDLVVDREPEEHREQEERQPGLDRVHLVEAEQARADAVLEDEHEQPVGDSDREQLSTTAVPATTSERKTTVRKRSVSVSTSAITHGAGPITELK